MHEGQAVTFQLLQDETFATEEPCTDTLVETDADLRAMGGAEKRILLADQRAADLAEHDRHHAAGIGRGETDPCLAPCQHC